MKMLLSGDNQNPSEIDPQEGAITIPPRGTLYLNLRGTKTPTAVVRHLGQLVMREGWISLDYDHDGYLIGMEVQEGDPRIACSDQMEYLQPKNPNAPEGN